MATKKSKSKTGSRKKASKKSIKKPKNRTPPGTPPDTIVKRYPDWKFRIIGTERAGQKILTSTYAKNLISDNSDREEIIFSVK